MRHDTQVWKKLFVTSLGHYCAPKRGDGFNWTRTLSIVFIRYNNYENEKKYMSFAAHQEHLMSINTMGITMEKREEEKIEIISFELIFQPYIEEDYTKIF